ncbi:MAG: helix-hairpin-helix domain-containing protein [Candidatus Thorarchaeota archaeon]|nr:MAG: helix-hairpin-helix domain-containing protein [Candidatus Thorarchaeota archaeon]
MRYALGVLVGALIPGIVLIGVAFINILGVGVTDPAVLQSLWSVFLTWVVISFIIFLAPLVVARYSSRLNFREIALFEIGGIAFFGPIWFAVVAEITGNSIMDILLNGVENALPAPDEFGRIVGVSIGPFMLIPILGLMLLVGLILLRPSFIERSLEPPTPSELAALTETAPSPARDTVEAEMPDVARPIADESTKRQLETLLTELGTPPETISAIVGAGFATVTDFVATSPDQIAIATGMDKKTAEDLHVAVQKKVWFGGIE